MKGRSFFPAVFVLNRVGFVLGFSFLTLFSADIAHGDAMWVWRNIDVVVDAEERNKLVQFCRSNNIDSVFLHVNSSSNLYNPNDPWADTIGALHDADIEVEALMGRVGWLMPADDPRTNLVFQNRSHATNLFTNIMDYQASQSDPRHRFDGFNFDIEMDTWIDLYPTITVTESNRVEWFFEIISEFKDIRASYGYDGHSLPFNWDISMAYDATDGHHAGLEVDDPDGVTGMKPAWQHFFDRFERITFMSYSDRHGHLMNNLRPELEYLREMRNPPEIRMAMEYQIWPSGLATMEDEDFHTVANMRLNIDSAMQRTGFYKGWAHHAYDGVMLSGYKKFLEDHSPTYPTTMAFTPALTEMEIPPSEDIQSPVWFKLQIRAHQNYVPEPNHTNDDRGNITLLPVGRGYADPDDLATVPYDGVAPTVWWYYNSDQEIRWWDGGASSRDVGVSWENPAVSGVTRGVVRHMQMEEGLRYRLVVAYVGIEGVLGRHFSIPVVAVNPDGPKGDSKQNPVVIDLYLDDIILANNAQHLNHSIAVFDNDFDGLTDGQEQAYRTDPLNVDTDGDGLTDFEEIMVYDTVATHQDSDGDGFPDSCDFSTEQVEQFVDVYSGWSRLSTHVSDCRTASELVQDWDIAGFIWFWDAMTQNSGIVPSGSPLAPAVGYFAFFRSDAQIAMSGPQMAYVASMKEGWNMIGAPSHETSLDPLKKLTDAPIWEWDSTRGNYTIPRKMVPGGAYWIQLAEPAEISFETQQQVATLVVDGPEPTPVAKDLLAKDTDGDALPDSAENNLELVTLSDSSKRDTDSDGLPDGWEVTRGLSANNASDAGNDDDGDDLDNQQEYSVIGEAKMAPRGASSWDNASRSIYVNNDLMIIGSPFSDDDGSASGSATIFEREHHEWKQIAKLTASDASAGDYFGVSVALSADRAMVGAYLDDDKGTSSGSVYIFKRLGEAWIEEQKITAHDGSGGDSLGFAIDASGERIIVGASKDDDKGSNSGSAYIYQFNGYAWVFAGKLLANDGAANDLFGYSVAIDGRRAVVGAFGEDVKGSSSGAAYIFEDNGAGWQQVAKVWASDGAAGDLLGYDVDISGDRVVAGSQRDDDNGTDAGSAYVFRRETSGSWVQEKKIRASTASSGDYFGYAVAIHNARIAIGAYKEDLGFSNAGALYVYERDQTDWQEVALLKASDRAATDYFGFSVSMDNDLVCVGGPYNDDNGSASGSAYVFDMAGTDPLEEDSDQDGMDDGFEELAGFDALNAKDGAEDPDADGLTNVKESHRGTDPFVVDSFNTELKVVAPDGQTADFFGYAGGIDGNYMVVGSYGDDDQGSYSGSATVFVRNYGTWTKVAKLLPNDGVASDYFGIAAAVSRTTIVVGASGHDELGSASGAAYVFERKNGEWVQVAKLTADDGVAGDNFGYSVAIDDSWIVVGARYDDDKGSNSGSVYVFEKRGDGWYQANKLVASDGSNGDLLGLSVSISGTRVVAGAIYDDDSFFNSGAAYVFERVGSSWSQTAKLKANDPASNDRLGYDVAIHEDRIIVSSHLDDDNGASSGSVYVFEFNGNTWLQAAKLKASDGAASDFFGIAVAVDGDRIAVGANGDDDHGSSSGSAYLFTKNGASWIEDKLTPSDGNASDSFGKRCVDLSPHDVMIGSHADDDKGLSSGSVYVY